MDQYQRDDLSLYGGLAVAVVVFAAFCVALATSL
jgi:hypothetical protein